MTLQQNKDALYAYLINSESMVDDHFCTYDSNGVQLRSFNSNALRLMIDVCRDMLDLEILCQRTLNFSWSVGFNEVCEYAGIDAQGYAFAHL